jgi:hypothetical protein
MASRRNASNNQRTTNDDYQSNNFQPSGQNKKGGASKTPNILSQLQGEKVVARTSLRPRSTNEGAANILNMMKNAQPRK